MVRPKNYDVDGYIHFVEKVKDSTQWDGDSDAMKKMPNKEAYEISFEYIENLNLNKVGNEILYTNNVWNLDRYLAYYWKQVMDAEAIFVWMHLWEYCDRDSNVDMCYPKMKELAERVGITKATLIKKIRLLEENNFLIQVHRLNKRNNNKEDSPIFKLRRTIPLLTREQYYKLTPLMQKKHDEYMNKFATDVQMDIFNHTTGSDIVDEMIDNVGDKIISKKTRKDITEMLKKEEEERYILENLPSNMKDTLKSFKEFTDMLVEMKKFSKPMAETYFKNCLVVYDNTNCEVHIIVRNKVGRDLLKETMVGHNMERLLDALINLYVIVENVKYFTTENYIISMMKGH
ncbi:helix-turn-helix domain-containing protein [Bacillus pumilus]|uniref:helix-turn-helix domain-containing protein n=1 Tax=Bacillus pumilus TaxID=1408 RepID=UPI0011A34C5D|nr:helix-turn-helix domain-containing protein [Bacillus pumilus]